MCFSETAAWNHFTMHMHISLGGLLYVCKNHQGGGGVSRIFVIHLNAFNDITIWQTVL